MILKNIMSQKFSPKPKNEKFPKNNIIENPSTNNLPPHISLKYYDYKHECFSQWTQRDLKDFSHLNELLSKTTWKEMIQNCSKNYGMKKGLGSTVIRDTNIHEKLPKNISKDCTLIELRVNEKSRIIGFRNNEIYFLIWLDRNHDLCE